MNVTYSESDHEESSIQFDVFSFKLFLERVRLIKWFNLYNKGYHDLDDGFDEQIHDDSLNRYNEYIKDENNGVQAKEQNHKYWRYWLQRNVQETYLNNNRIKNPQIVDIYFPYSSTQKNLFLPMRFSDFNSDEFILKLNLDMFQLDMGQLPERSGEGDLYKSKIKSQISDYLKDKKFLQPVLTPITLTIISKQGNKQHKDLDNIAREIIKIILDKLKPPTSLSNSLQPIEKEIHKKYIEKHKIVNRNSSSLFPKEGFVSYRVLYMPQGDDEEDKYVKLNIHDSKIGNDFQMYLRNKIWKMKEHGAFS